MLVAERRSFCDFHYSMGDRQQRIPSATDVLLGLNGLGYAPISTAEPPTTPCSGTSFPSSNPVAVCPPAR